MRLRNRLFGKKTGSEAAQSSASGDERESKVRAILAPLVLQRVIDSSETLSYITNMVVNMAEPKQEQNAVKMIAGIMNQLASEPRREFFLAIGEALLIAYGPDHASRLTQAIVQEHSRLAGTQ